MNTVVRGVSIPNPFGLFSAGLHSAVNFSTNTILDGFSSWLADGAATLVTHVTQLMTQSTDPNLNANSAGFFLPTGAMLQLTTFLVLPLLLVATIGAVLRQDLRRLGRTWCVALPGAMLAAGAAVELSAVGLQVTDALCAVVTHSINPSLQTIYSNVGKALTGSLLTGSPFIASLISAIFILGGMSLWLELILRSAAIYLAVFFLPLALAGLVWPATAHWAKRMVELLVAVILSKFVIVVALALAVRAVANGSTADDVLAGAAIFLLASFAPFVLLRFTPIIEAAAISHMEGVSRRPIDAARSAGARATGAIDSALGGLVGGRGTASSSDAAPAASAVQGVKLATTGGEVDREFAAMATGGGGVGAGGGGSGGGRGSGSGGSPGDVPGSGGPPGGGETPAGGRSPGGQPSANGPTGGPSASRSEPVTSPAGPPVSSSGEPDGD